MITTAQIFRAAGEDPCDPDFVAAHPDPREAISACLAKVQDRTPVGSIYTDAREWHHIRWACLVLCGREVWDAIADRWCIAGTSAGHWLSVNRAWTEACADRLCEWLDHNYPQETT